MIKERFYRMMILFSFFLSAGSLYAQTRTVTGNVKDENGQPLAAVVVTEVGGNHHAFTDQEGNYSITVGDNAKFLQFSYTGKQTLVKAIVSGGGSLNAQLQATDSHLNDVVVIGYGTQKRGDINGAVSSLSAKDIEDIPQSTVDQMMQGKIAGVTITNNSGAPGAAVSVMVRGITSFSGTQPLYVIDGVVIDGNASQAANSNQLSGLSPTAQETTFSVLGSLNPDDIASIDVLKDASATAIYGSRGANGVVIITTKHGKEGETGKLAYDGFWGEQTQGKFLNMMNLSQYAAFQNTLTSLGFSESYRTEFADPSELGPGTNWQDAIFRNGTEQSHTLSFSGATAKTNFYVSGGFFQQEGTIIGSNYTRYSFHTSINSQINPWLKFGTNVTANSNTTNIGLGNNYGIIYNALLEAPDVAVYNADGTFSGPVVLPDGTLEGGENPVQQALTITNYLTKENFQGNMFADATFIKGLTLHSEIDGNFDWGQAKIFEPTFSYGATGSGSAYMNNEAQMLENDNLDNYWNWQEYLNFNRTYGKHNISAMVGREVWLSTYDGLVPTNADYLAGNTIQTVNLGDQTTNVQSGGTSINTDNITEPKGSNSMESYFARIIYTYDNKYSITASDRKDRSANFAPGHQVGYFPGVAVSWKISEESFMKSLDHVISNLKLRAGYGTTGNANVPQYAYGSTLTAASTGLGTGFVFNNFANPNLTWETAKQTNIGLDFGLLNDRITGALDWYSKSSSNFLFQQPLPAFVGGATAEYSSVAVVQSPWINAGKLSNKGIDISITGHEIQNKNFTWTTNVVFSHYTNKIVSLNDAPQVIGQVSTGFGPTINVTNSVVGGPIGEFYGYKMMGIIKTQAQLQYLATSPQNVTGSAEPISSDRTNASAIYLGDIEYAGNNNGAPNTQYALGNPNPSFTYSMTNTFTYKSFELSIFLNGSYGGKIFNAVSLQTEGEYALYINQRADVANFWTPNNPNSNIPTPRAAFGNNNLVMSDRFLESASYLRIQNVRIGYNLPAAWAKKVFMSSLKAYVSGQNIYTFTKYSGLDPEVGALNQNPILQNIDYGRYPSPRVVTVGLNAAF